MEERKRKTRQKCQYYIILEILKKKSHHTFTEVYCNGNKICSHLGQKFIPLTGSTSSTHMCDELCVYTRHNVEKFVYVCGNVDASALLLVCRIDTSIKSLKFVYCWLFNDSFFL